MAKQQFYLRLMVSMFLAFLFSSFLTGEIFVGQGPRVKENLPVYLTQRSKGVIKSITKPFTKLFYQTSVTLGKVEESPSQVLKESYKVPVAGGIYSREEGDISYLLIKEDEVNWQLAAFDIDGKSISVKFPKGESPPADALLDKIF